MRKLPGASGEPGDSQGVQKLIGPQIADDYADTYVARLILRNIVFYEQWRTVVETNVTGALCTTAEDSSLPYMRKPPSPQIAYVRRFGSPSAKPMAETMPEPIDEKPSAA